MLESTMLLISDDPALNEAVRTAGRPIENLKLAVLPKIDQAYSYHAWDQVALVMIHQRLRGPSTDVERLLRMIAAARRPIATLVMADDPDVEQAQTLLRLGVADYIGRPIVPDRLTHLIDVLTVRARLAAREKQASSTASDPLRRAFAAASPIFDDESPEMARLMGLVRRVAPQETTILLIGETGTGKTRLARTIHELSSRRAEPFLVVNCGALSTHSIESELFGHVRGSFAGADRDHSGKFTEVGRGTLFFDEIDNLPIPVQSKLLRIVEDRVFEAVGSNRSEPFRARLIAASNRALDQEVAAHRFRSDLFYRLNVVGFQLPPLRDRRGAIPILVEHFIAESVYRNGSNVDSISDEALRLLEEHDWPGNIRELRNVIERAVVLCLGREIGREDLPESVMPGASWPTPPVVVSASPTIPSIMTRLTLDQSKRAAEVTRITQALEKHGNNRLRTASELGISRMTLYKKLYKYGLMTHDLSRGGVA
jgi:DNA-binding NtrC family response regulator